MMVPEAGEELCFPELLNTSCRKPTPPWLEAVLLHGVLSSLSVLTVALNLLVIISVSHFRQLHTPTNILLLSLAVSDFLVGLLLLPAEINQKKSCWFHGGVVCYLCYYVSLIISSSSVGVMVLISIDRYVAICYPLHYSSRITERRAAVCVCLCWFCCVLYDGFMIKDLHRADSFASCRGECVLTMDPVVGAVDIVVSFIMPVSLIIVLYVRVFVVALSQARAMRHVTTITTKKSELKAARTLGVVVVAFLICFCPFYCVSLTGDMFSVSSVSFDVYLFYFNSCLNPVIYALFYPWFRKALKLIGTLQILKLGSSEANVL